MHSWSVKIIGILIISFLFLSCSEDKSNPIASVPEIPTIKILSPTADTEYINEVLLEVEANDNKGITKVEFYLDNEIKKDWILPPYKITWSLAGQNDSTKHSIYFKAYDADGNVVSSNIIMILARKLMAPSNLIVEELVTNQVKLAWKDNSNIEEEYEIEMKVNTRTFVKIGIAAKNTQNITISNSFEYDSTYQFRVRAKNVDKYSNYSNSTPAKGLPPEKPILINPINNYSANYAKQTFNWSNCRGTDRYTLQISKNENFDNYYLIRENIYSAQVVLVGLDYNTKYYWRILSISPFGEVSISDTRVLNINTITCENSISYLNKNYSVVKIGNRCWINENMNIGVARDWFQNCTNNGIIEKYCFQHDSVNCETYGALYTWDEAMQYSRDAGGKGICPDDWHIPTLEELKNLGEAVQNNGNALKAIGQGIGNGAGTNSSGFAAMLGGGKYSSNRFENLNGYGILWSSTENGTVYAKTNTLYYNNASITYYDYDKSIGFSIRCVKD